VSPSSGGNYLDRAIPFPFRRQGLAVLIGPNGVGTRDRIQFVIRCALNK
jgi:hypothetical protein